MENLSLKISLFSFIKLYLYTKLNKKKKNSKLRKLRKFEIFLVLYFTTNENKHFQINVILVFLTNVEI